MSMLVGRVRPRETRTLDLEGDSLAEVQAKAQAATPAGWELVSVPVAMTKGTTRLTAVATIARRDGVTEVEADTMDGLLAKVPEGSQLITVRSL